ncbi:MAG: TetR family transcriptional regulator [Lachnospiraceae bacterium]|nr:TetR family transcriptional regulator [Lachnospiraceae bacterium]
MFKGTPELIAQRREEIISACEKLYQTMSFKEITLKEIGNETSFSRPAIYNYFHTREEIFLALYELEYKRWNEDLEKILEEETPLTRVQVAEKIARSLEKREQLLKLLSMNNYDMEANSRPELLITFKAAYGRSMTNIRSILTRFCPELSKEEQEIFIYVFYPFMFGIYPYTEVTEKQETAMRDAQVDFTRHSIYEITYNCLIRLLDQ